MTQPKHEYDAPFERPWNPECLISRDYVEYWRGTLESFDPFIRHEACHQRYGMTQREIDCGLYGFTNRYY